MVAWHYAMEIRLLRQWQENMGIKKQRLSMMLLKIRDQENAAIIRATIRSFFFGVVVKALESWLVTCTIPLLIVMQD